MSETVFISGGDGRLGMMAEILYENYYGMPVRSMSQQAEICAPYSEITEQVLNTYGYSAHEKQHRKLQLGFVAAASKLIVIAEQCQSQPLDLDALRYIDVLSPDITVWEVPRYGKYNNENFFETENVFLSVEQQLVAVFGQPNNSLLNTAKYATESTLVGSLARDEVTEAA